MPQNRIICVFLLYFCTNKHVRMGLVDVLSRRGSHVPFPFLLDLPADGRFLLLCCLTND